MPVDNLARVDIHHFLDMQSRERYRAFVIHAPPLKGKTHFAQRLSEVRKASVYFDVLRYIVSHSDLAKSIDRIDAKALFEIVVSQAISTNAELLLVDEIDFLVHTWGDNLADFIHRVEWLSCTQMPTIIGFILQTRLVLEEWKLLSTAGYSRILPLDRILSLQSVLSSIPSESEE